MARQHELYKSEYATWNAMRHRCYNPKSNNYADYGGRGITVCDEWRTSFHTFLADMGYKPSPELTLDRIDNDKGYSKGNCRWATRKTQANNRRDPKNSVRITIAGRTQTLTKWAKESGLAPHVIYGRRKAGKTGAELISPEPQWKTVGEDSPRATITAAIALAIYNAPGTQVAIAAQFGTTPSIVSMIKLGKTWKSVTGA